MLKIFLALLGVLISVYWVGEKARNNVKINEFLLAMEWRYAKLNGKLEDATIKNGLQILRQFYGWFSVLLFTCLFLIQRFFQPETKSTLPLFWCFSFTFMGWFSIKWVANHKTELSEFSRNNAIIIFAPLILGICDVLFDTPFMGIIFSPFQQIATPLPFNIPLVSNPIGIGAAISLFLLVLFCIYYFITWLITGPIFLISIFVVVLPIYLARLLAKIDRNNTFFWLTVVIMIGITIILTQI